MLLSQRGLLFQLLLWHNKQPQNLVVKTATCLIVLKDSVEFWIQNEHSADGFSLSAVTGVFTFEGDITAGSWRFAAHMLIIDVAC